ncbi:hypothetical protein V1477_007157 [Vespula maculifrons]|uniref:Uncharacterized protein n=1 Tax=Vespula maculifrons TaxID=7453 RepID=A0ABD2CHS3_VESMC
MNGPNQGPSARAFENQNQCSLVALCRHRCEPPPPPSATAPPPPPPPSSPPYYYHHHHHHDYHHHHHYHHHRLNYRHYQRNTTTTISARNRDHPSLLLVVFHRLELPTPLVRSRSPTAGVGSCVSVWSNERIRNFVIKKNLEKR